MCLYTQQHRQPNMHGALHVRATTLYKQVLPSYIRSSVYTYTHTDTNIGLQAYCVTYQKNFWEWSTRLLLFFLFLVWPVYTYLLQVCWVIIASDNIQGHTHTRQDSCVGVIGPSHRPLLDKTQHSQKTDIHATGRIRTHKPCRRAAADPCLRPRGQWDRPLLLNEGKFIISLPHTADPLMNEPLTYRFRK
jgi:hypothetical protein